MDTGTNKKQAYQERVEAEIQQRRAELEQLAAKARKSKSEAQVGFDQAIEDLNRQLNEWEGRLGELKESGKESWETVKEGVEHSWEAFSDSLKKARDKWN